MRGCARFTLRMRPLNISAPLSSRNCAPEYAAQRRPGWRRPLPWQGADAETGDLASRVEAGQRPATGGEHACMQIRLEAGKRFTRQDVQFHRDEWAVSWIENRRGLRHADEPLAEQASRAVGDCELRVLPRRIARL